ncbi:hypothetical protein [Bradyrhizobium barranii]|uniref:PD-(D/E)XK nuclease domain-containing protein n=1 Tax=Bradyrhizobium barranii TaxID=2992140 RepID=UPI003D15FEA0
MGKKDPDVILRLAERLHAVVRQLRERREERPTLQVEDEYDVQDLFHALLVLHFDDIRKEEWARRRFPDGLLAAGSRDCGRDQDDAPLSFDKTAW